MVPKSHTNSILITSVFFAGKVSLTPFQPPLCILFLIVLCAERSEVRKIIEKHVLTTIFGLLDFRRHHNGTRPILDILKTLHCLVFVTYFQLLSKPFSPEVSSHHENRPKMIKWNMLSLRSLPQQIFEYRTPKTCENLL